jgi:hypothetical protein
MDLLLAQFVKIREVGCPKILPLGILQVLLVDFFAYPFDIFVRVLSNTGIVFVWANNNVHPITEFQIGVGPATVKTVPNPWGGAAYSAAACGGGGAAIGGKTTTRKITRECFLGLTGECTRCLRIPLEALT